MISFYKLEDIRAEGETAVTIGKFDGLHRGHRALLDELTRKKEEGLKTVVFSLKFPSTGDNGVKTIFTAAEKEEMLANLGIDYYVCIDADEKFFSISAEDFLNEVLLEKLHMKHYICGSDNTFGYQREGDAAFMKRKGAEKGFGLTVVSDTVRDNERISSNMIRNMIIEGRVSEASECLLQPYVISGEVVHGKALGRQLGFPTLNIYPDEQKLLPRFGVYHVECLIEGVRYYGIGNIGIKPTVTDEVKDILEVHLLHFNGDLYGKYVTTKFLTFIRPEKKFDGIEALKNQVLSDIRHVEENEKNN